ncbi:MAG: DNA repair protein RecO [Candidatus Eisenbacteria bacterium]|nr:DNA repair protein RecO [Candidatus Eisenbacteria bacterium]
MALVRVEGIVLRNLRFGDTSRVVTILSRELGKWSGVAKGARDPKGRIGAALEILNLSSIIAYHKHGRDLQMIADASLEREHRALLEQSARYHHGCAVTEFLDSVLEEDSPVPEVFDLALRVLRLLEEAPEERLSYLLRAFQLRAASLLGYSPRLEFCGICGAAGGSCFGVAEGSILCVRCAERTPGSIDLLPESLRLLAKLGAGKLPRAPSDEACAQLGRIVESFLSFHLERYRGLRSLRGLEAAERLRAGRPVGSSEARGGESP